jgi:hypothetical protein
VGQAVLVHGEPRLTQDVDITLGVTPFEPEPLLKIAKTLKLKVLVADPEEFLRQTFVLPVFDEDTGIRVDLICSLSEYERETIARAIIVTVGTTNVRFIGLEDLVIHKVIAGRARDLEDVRALLLKHPSYDAKFVHEWLRRHDEELGTDFEVRLEGVAPSSRS